MVPKKGWQEEARATPWIEESGWDTGENRTLMGSGQCAGQEDVLYNIEVVR